MHNDTHSSFYKSRILVMPVYSDVLMKWNYSVCYLHRIVDEEILIATLHQCIGLCCTITHMLGDETQFSPPHSFDIGGENAPS